MLSSSVPLSVRIESQMRFVEISLHRLLLFPFSTDESFNTFSGKRIASPNEYVPTFVFKGGKKKMKIYASIVCLVENYSCNFRMSGTENSSLFMFP